MELTIFERRGQLYVDSREVAQMVGKSHKNLLRDIYQYIKTMQKTTELKIEPSDFFTESTYKDSTGRKLPRFDCTKMGCEMIAHKLTGDKGILFTAVYIKQFHAMERALMERQSLQWQQLRLEGKAIRRTLTDAIRDSGEDERMHGHAYATYTDLAYKFATGKTARQLRKERGALPKATATDFLTADELAQYNTMEGRITVLLDMGLQYDQIKGLLLHQLTAKAAS